MTILRALPALVAAALLGGVQFAAGELTVKKEHPRLWMTPELRRQLKEKFADAEAAKKAVENAWGCEALGPAVAYQMSKDAKYVREAAGALDRKTRLSEQDIVGFDWVYDGLSEEEKKKFAEKIYQTIKRYPGETSRMWRTFDADQYPPGNHLGLGALAIYHEHPGAPERLRLAETVMGDGQKAFKTLFPDGDFFEGFDYNRHASRFMAMYALARKTATGDDWFKDNTYYRNHAWYIIYWTFPNGFVLNMDDVSPAGLTDWEAATLHIYCGMFRNPYALGYIRKNQSSRRALELGEIFIPKDLEPKPLSELPLSRIFRGKGVVVSRGGWGDDDTIVAFRCGDYFGDHCHLDVGNFVIYKKCPLVPDAGIYEDDWGTQGDPRKTQVNHFFNYYQRAIGHNTILVYDPDETFRAYENAWFRNDGGQMIQCWRNGDRHVPACCERPFDGRNAEVWLKNPGRWETGDVIAYEDTDAFTYVAGDCTRAYSPAKMKKFVRQLVFLRPDTVVIFDRVEVQRTRAGATGPGGPYFKPTWLIHSENPPVIEANRFTFSDKATLHGVTLLPEEATLQHVRGFMVDGVDCKITRGIQPHETPGPNRIEVSPKTPAAVNYFLHVLDVSQSAPQARLIDAAETSGVELKIGGKTCRVFFDKGENTGGRTVIDGKSRPLTQKVAENPEIR